MAWRKNIHAMSKERKDKIHGDMPLLRSGMGVEGAL